jgi:hypothetical protein
MTTLLKCGSLKKGSQSLVSFVKDVVTQKLQVKLGFMVGGKINYVSNKEGENISRLSDINSRVCSLAGRFDGLVGVENRAPFGFFCRIGYSESPWARSTRKELIDLMK